MAKNEMMAKRGLPQSVRLSEGLGRIRYRQFDWTAHVATRINISASRPKPAESDKARRTLPTRDQRLRTKPKANAIAIAGTEVARASVGK